MTLSNLETYLLPRMSAVDLVEDVAARHSLSLAYLRRVASELAAAYNLDDPIHSAMGYLQLAPDVPISTVVVGAEHGPRFAGSTRFVFQLPTWPHVHFQVHQHPTGFTWGRGFRGSVDARSLEPGAVRPWDWTASVLLENSTSHHVVDEWTEYRILRLKFGQEIYEGVFDMDLLQRWSVISDPSGRCSERVPG